MPMRIKLADTEIDFDRMTTRRAGETRRLTRQSHGILRALHEAAGDVVTKDDLIEQVWGGRIITDATLSTAMKEARHAVGDTGAAQRVIETVHGVGFRLTRPAQAEVAHQRAKGERPVVLVLPFRALGAVLKNIQLP